MATTPEPMLRIELEWRGPETLLITVENKFDEIRFDATMFVTGGIGPRLIHEEPCPGARRKTDCSAESAAACNEAVVAELGDDAPAAYRE